MPAFHQERVFGELPIVIPDADGLGIGDRTLLHERIEHS